MNVSRRDLAVAGAVALSAPGLLLGGEGVAVQTPAGARVFHFDIDDLQKVVDSNLEGRMHSAEEAEAIIREEVERMMARLKTREVVPIIVSLQEQLEKLRAGELARMRGKFGTLTPEQEEALIALTKGIINKIAHGPISELRRQANEPDGNQVVVAIRKVFRLGD